MSTENLRREFLKRASAGLAGTGLALQRDIISSPIFLRLGRRLRAPDGKPIGNTYQARMFSQYVDALRADAIRNRDTKIYRRFTLYERLNMNFAIDMLNMTKLTQFSAPRLTVTATSFGYVTGQANGARQLQLNLRIEF